MSEEEEGTGAGGQSDPSSEIAAGSVDVSALKSGLFGAGGPLSGTSASNDGPKTPAPPVRKRSGIQPPSSGSKADPEFFTPAMEPVGEKWDPSSEIKSGSVMANAKRLWGAGGAFGKQSVKEEEEGATEEAAPSPIKQESEVNGEHVAKADVSFAASANGEAGGVPIESDFEAETGLEELTSTKKKKKKDKKEKDKSKKKKKDKKKKKKDKGGEDAEVNEEGEEVTVTFSGTGEAADAAGEEAAVGSDHSMLRNQAEEELKEGLEEAAAIAFKEDRAMSVSVDVAGTSVESSSKSVGSIDAEEILAKAASEAEEEAKRSADNLAKKAAEAEEGKAAEAKAQKEAEKKAEEEARLAAEEAAAAAEEEARLAAEEAAAVAAAEEEAKVAAEAKAKEEEEERHKTAEENARRWAEEEAETIAEAPGGEEARRKAEEVLAKAEALAAEIRAEEEAKAEALAAEVRANEEAEDCRRAEEDAEKAAASLPAAPQTRVEEVGAEVGAAARAPEKWDPSQEIARGSVTSNAARIFGASGLLNTPKADKVDASAEIASGAVSSNARRIFGEGVVVERKKKVVPPRKQEEKNLKKEEPLLVSKHLDDTADTAEASEEAEEVDGTAYEMPLDEGQVAKGHELLMKRFDVRPGATPLRHAASEFLIRATDLQGVEGEGGIRPVVLQFMSDARSFAAELSARGAVRDAVAADATPSILPAVAAFVDADGAATESLRFTSQPAVEVAPCDDLAGCAASLLPRSGDEAQEGGDESEPRYPYLLVLEDHGPTLEDFLSRVPLADLGLARTVAADVVEAAMRLHTAGLVHRNLTPSCIVWAAATDGQEGRGRWQVAGLGSCGRDGDKVHGRGGVASRCSRWGYLPPEAARVILGSGGGDGASSNSTSLDVCVTDPAWDLWSLGCVLYRLVLGVEVWKESRDGRISERDLAQLAGWSSRSIWRRESKETPQGGKTDEERAAIDLVAKLLTPTPEGRLQNFELGIFSVHEHEFVEGKPLEEASLLALEGRWRLLSMEACDRERYLLLTGTLGIEERWELDRARDVLLLGVFEPVDVHVPTSFVILKEPIASREGGANAEGVAEACLGEAMQWLSFLDDVGPLVRRTLISGGVRSIGEFWNKVEVMFGGEYCFFYFIDDLTGEPVIPPSNGVSGSYPIPIKTRGDMLPKLLPLMHSAMRSTALYHGAVGLARMFGAGSNPFLSDEARTSSQERIDDLKSESGGIASSPFGSFVDDINEVRQHREYFLQNKLNVRCRSQVELVRFLERRGIITHGKHGVDGDFAGLHRLADDTDRAIWTVLDSEAAVKRAIFIRKEERLKEEQSLWGTSKVGSIVRELEASLETTNKDINDAKCTHGSESNRAKTAEERICDLEEELRKTRIEFARVNERVTELDRRGLGAVANPSET
mmetsp:Transcript_20491/g.59394  ORF Transcript_20491/g.59394 Transcript_20491/m.59394 type:complete len:1407 (-) Transcript_20491:71-4291(-)